MDKEKSITYNLCSTERKYRNDTLISYYFQSNKQIIKKFAPVDIDGERYRMDLETGEIIPYTKKQVLESTYASLRRTKILMNMFLEMNDFDWFWTLTFDKEKIDRTNDLAVFNCYEKYINNIKKQFPLLKYMCFPERHEDGCVHFHLLVAGITPKQMGLVNSGKVCCHWATKGKGVCSREYFEKTKHLHELKETDGETIFNITTFPYGYTTVSRIVSRERCNSYVKKYVEKALGSTEVFKKRFYYSSNLNIPDIVKRLICVDFDRIGDIEKTQIAQDNPLVQFSKGQYKNDYNVLQIKIDNETKELIDSGFIPLTENELYELEKMLLGGNNGEF